MAMQNSEIVSAIDRALPAFSATRCIFHHVAPPSLCRDERLFQVGPTIGHAGNPIGAARPKPPTLFDSS
jgi:hypothetical protein